VSDPKLLSKAFGDSIELTKSRLSVIRYASWPSGGDPQFDCDMKGAP